jgi:hypothetical protein
MSALCSYEWPGNIRELQNLIERAVILLDDGILPNGQLIARIGPYLIRRNQSGITFQAFGYGLQPFGIFSQPRRTLDSFSPRASNRFVRLMGNLSQLV